MIFLNSVIWFGVHLLTINQADWEETNRKALVFAALQQDDEEDEDDDDDEMVKDDAPTIPVAKNVFEIEMENEDSKPATNNPATTEEADEIT
jgi:hypothetical protein